MSKPNLDNLILEPVEFDKTLANFMAMVKNEGKAMIVQTSKDGHCGGENA